MTVMGITDDDDDEEDTDVNPLSQMVRMRKTLTSTPSVR